MPATWPDWASAGVDTGTTQESVTAGATEAIVGSSADIYVSGLVHVDAQLTETGDAPMDRG